MNSKEQIQLFEQMLTAQSNFIYDRIRNEQDKAIFLEQIYKIHRRVTSENDFHYVGHLLFGNYKRTVLDKYPYKFFSNPKKYTIMASQIAFDIHSSIDKRFSEKGYLCWYDNE